MSVNGTKQMVINIAARFVAALALYAAIAGCAGASFGGLGGGAAEDPRCAIDAPKVCDAARGGPVTIGGQRADRTMVEQLGTRTISGTIPIRDDSGEVIANVACQINAQHQTGRLWSRQIRPAGLGFPSAPIVNMKANTGERRVEDVDLIDLRVQKEFKLAGTSRRLAFFLDALNMTNSNHNENVANQLGTAAVTAFGVPTRLYLPRRVQLGTKLRW